MYPLLMLIHDISRELYISDCIDMRKLGLDAQKDNVVTLMNFIFSQTQQQYMVRSAFINS